MGGQVAVLFRVMPQAVDTDLKAMAEAARAGLPAGVAALITPWNTPFMLESWKVAPCLAAGDCLILKPAEWSPATAAPQAGHGNCVAPGAGTARPHEVHRRSTFAIMEETGGPATCASGCAGARPAGRRI